MNLNTIVLLLISTIFLNSCADYKTDRTLKKKEKQYYSSLGFALIYSDHHYLNKVVNKKIKNGDPVAMHNFLKINTPIKIINPDNSKFIETKIYKRADYPKIFNVVISRKIASFLELDFNNPYVEIIEVKKNKTFVAKEGNIFEEEKNVIDKVPVDEIKINDLTLNKPKINKKLTKKNNFILVISDFYYMDSANNLKNELIKKININNLSIKKINNNKYRLLVGPFESFNALKTTYISLNKLGFEDLNVYNE
jgi:hypothetical protein